MSATLLEMPCPPLLVDHHVTAGGHHAGADGPHVQIVHVADAAHAADAAQHRMQIQPCRGGLKQHAHALHQDPP